MWDSAWEQSHCLARRARTRFFTFRGINPRRLEGWNSHSAGFVTRYSIHRRIAASGVNSYLLLFPPANEVWGKVIFLHLSVILFTGGGVPGQVSPLTRHKPLPPGTRHTARDQAHPPGDQVHTHLPEQCMLGDMGNKWAVRILLECILVSYRANQTFKNELTLKHCRINVYIKRMFLIIWTSRCLIWYQKFCTIKMSWYCVVLYFEPYQISQFKA